jgi:hypothetical protein
MLHKGGQMLTGISMKISGFRDIDRLPQRIRFVLIGFLSNLASHLERSTLSHSYSYASTVDRSICLASWTRIPDPFMQHAG